MLSTFFLFFPTGIYVCCTLGFLVPGCLSLLHLCRGTDDGPREDFTRRSSRQKQISQYGGFARERIRIRNVTFSLRVASRNSVTYARKADSYSSVWRHNDDVSVALTVSVRMRNPLCEHRNEYVTLMGLRRYFSKCFLPVTSIYKGSAMICELVSFSVL